MKQSIAYPRSNSILVSIVFLLFSSSLFANLPPVAVNDQWYTYKNETVWHTVADNDFDPDGDQLTYSILTPPIKGTWTLNPNGSYEYIPQPWNWGPVTMQYQVCDPGGLCATGTLTMFVIFVNDPPQINDDYFYVPSGSILNASVRTNDVEPDGEVLFYSILTQPLNGSLSMILTGPNSGNFTYTPNAGFQGQDQFRVSGCDPCQECGTSWAYITVGPPNNPPTASDAAFITNEDAVLNGSLSSFATDPNGDNLIFSSVSGPPNANLTIQANGAFTFTPNQNWHGVTTATYKACDPFNACSPNRTLTFTVVSVNDSPVCQDNYVEVLEDEVLQGSVATNDFDVDGDVLTYSVMTGPAHGLFFMDQSGNYTYTPNENYHGPDQVTYMATDPGGLSDSATLFVTVISVNDAPVANDVFVTIQRNSVFIGNVAFNDFDVDGDPLTYSIVGLPENGVFTLQPNGNCTYTPAYNFSGTDVMIYKATDPFGLFGEGQLIVDVLFTDEAPVAVNDVFETDEDTQLVGDVSLNDFDPDNDDLTFSVLTNPSNGAVAMQPNGMFTYTPNLNFNGQDQFSYIATDTQGNSGSATVVITVHPVNDAPVCQTGFPTVLEDAILTYQIIATDVDGDQLTFSYLNGNEVGTLSISSMGIMNYQPSQDFNGIVTITYGVNDGQGGECTGAITITVVPVNDAPVCDDNFFSGPEDQSIAGNVSLNDFDVDGDVLTYQMVVQPSFGSISMNATGSFSYQPLPNYHGNDQARYRATDPGGLWDEADILFEITPVNDEPISVNQTFNMFWNEVFSGVVQAFDVDGDVLTFSVTGNPENGEFIIGAGGLFTYTPNEYFFGAEVIGVQICDNELCVSINVTINIFAENVPPVAVDDLFVGLEDVLLSGSVAFNDYDLNGDPMVFSLLDSPAYGQMTMSPNGSFTFMPDQDWWGITSGTYQVCDPHGACTEGLFTIEISNVNDAPTVMAASMSQNENTQFIGSVAANASDIDGDALTFSVVSPPQFGVFNLQANGNFTFSPPLFYNGVVTAVWQACDPSGACSQTTLTLTIIPVNHAPIVADETLGTFEDSMLIGNVLLNDYDPDGDPLTVTAITPPPFGTWTLNSQTGHFTYLAPPNWFGELQVTYQVCDSFGLCATGTLTMIIVWMNDTPIANPDFFVMNHNTVLAGDVSLNDVDYDNDPLTYTLVSGSPNGNFVLNSDGTFVFTPNPYFLGNTQATYMVCDIYNACSTGTVNISVFFSNDPPVAVPDTYTMGKNTVLQGNVGLNDNDPQNDILTFTLTTANISNGVLEFNSDGSFTFTPNLQFVGNVNFNYSVCDIYNACTTASVTIAVLNVNSPPVFTAPIGFGCSGVAKPVDLSECVLDHEQSFSSLTFSEAGSDAGEVMITDGILVFQANPDFTGEATVWFDVCDNAPVGPQCTTAMFVWEVFDIEGEVLIAYESLNHVLCFGDNNGSIELEAMNEEPLLFFWSNVPGGDAQFDLVPGEYNLTILGAESCLAPYENTFVIEGPAMPLFVDGLEALPINDTPGGASEFVILGGTPPYNCHWLNAEGTIISETPELGDLSSSDLQGSYTLVVVDANGCTISETIVVTNLSEVEDGIGSLVVFPNPSSGVFRFSMPADLIGSVELTLYDALGRIIRGGTIVNSASFEVDLTGEARGIYHYVINAREFVFQGKLVLH